MKDPYSRLAWMGAALVALISISPAGAQQPEALSVAVTKVAAMGPVFVSDSTGLFKKAGLDVKFVLFDSGQTTLMGAASKSADVCLCAITSSAFVFGGGNQLKAIAGTTKDGPGQHDSGMVATNAAWDAGFRSPKDLPGKRIGVTSVGGSVDYQVALIAQKYGFDAKSVTLVPLNTVANLVAVLKGGQNQVNGIFTASPVPDQMEAEHLGHTVFWSGDEAPWQKGLAMAHPDIIKSKREALVKFLKGYSDGIVAYNRAFHAHDAGGKPVKGPEFDAYTKAIGDGLGVTPASIAAIFPYMTDIDPALTYDTKDLEKQIAYWQSRGAVEKSVTLDQVIDRSFGYAR